MRIISTVVPILLLPGLMPQVVRAQQVCRPANVQAQLVTTAPHASARQGNILVASQFGSATLIDLDAGTTTQFAVGGSPHHADVSPDGRWGIVADFVGGNNLLDGNSIHVIDMRSKKHVRTINTGEYKGLHDISFRPGHPTRALITAQTSRKIIEVDVVTGKIIGSIDTRGDRSHTLAVTPDGNTAFTANEGTATISRLDVASLSFVRSFPATTNVEGIAVARNGTEVWAGELRDTAVVVRDAQTGEVLTRFKGFRVPNVLRASSNGRYIVISDQACATLTIADQATRSLLRTIQMPRKLPIMGDFSPDARIAFVSLATDAAVVAVDLETGAMVGRYSVPTHPDGLGWGPKPTP